MGVVGVAGVGNVFDEAARVSSGSAGRDKDGPDDVGSGGGGSCMRLAAPLPNCADERLLAIALLSLSLSLTWGVEMVSGGMCRAGR